MGWSVGVHRPSGQRSDDSAQVLGSKVHPRGVAQFMSLKRILAAVYSSGEKRSKCLSGASGGKKRELVGTLVLLRIPARVSSAEKGGLGAAARRLCTPRTLNLDGRSSREPQHGVGAPQQLFPSVSRAPSKKQPLHLSTKAKALGTPRCPLRGDGP